MVPPIALHRIFEDIDDHYVTTCHLPSTIVCLLARHWHLIDAISTSSIHIERSCQFQIVRDVSQSSLNLHASILDTYWNCDPVPTRKYERSINVTASNMTSVKLDMVPFCTAISLIREVHLLQLATSETEAFRVSVAPRQSYPSTRFWQTCSRLVFARRTRICIHFWSDVSHWQDPRSCQMPSRSVTAGAFYSRAGSLRKFEGVTFFLSNDTKQRLHIL